ncbi:hypothetical protein DNL40_12030 [Xylanimonas oleitrophica]|uniref:DUF3800 domain-containing protein n=2 Tax=Xylanimonas oleitrophica TaxID=2607479 RepID=A0A2W5WM56_9MICO|nr:hypothetical protein DNL40_12030 [Xylanimonas oleitrophica]
MMRGGQMFVDESTSGDYLLMCAVVAVKDVNRARTAMQARGRCVRRLAQDAIAMDIARVVLDPIDSVVDRDRSWLIQGAREAGRPAPPFAYHHQKRHEEPLLWIADAVGWAWARGGKLRAAVDSVVTVVDL